MATFNPIYTSCFAASPEMPATDPKASIGCPISELPVDFSVRTKAQRDWKDIAKDINLIIAKIIIVPWGICSVGHFLLKRFVMSLVYPAQSQVLGCWKRTTDDLRRDTFEKLSVKNYIVRHVVLEKNGVRYSGLLIGHEKTIRNGRWTLHATANNEPIECHAEEYAKEDQRCNFNTLLINGPGVGRSEGWADPETIGDAQEVGLSFLETAIKAKEILLSGFSMGGAAIGQAILQHKFIGDVHYTVVFQKTFDRLSNMANQTLGCWAGYLIKWLDLEMDTVQASEKLLDKENIQQIIVQAGPNRWPTMKVPKEIIEGDGTIPATASLSRTLNVEGHGNDRRYYVGANSEHLPVDACACIKDAEERLEIVKKWLIQGKELAGSKSNKSLDFSKLNINDQHLGSILEHCSDLESLNLKGRKTITDAGLRSIEEHCPKLEMLNLTGCICITEPACQRLFKKYPELILLGPDENLIKPLK